MPDGQQQHSMLPLLHAGLPTERFQAAVQEAKIGPDKDIPHLSAASILTYVCDLRALGLLG